MPYSGAHGPLWFRAVTGAIMVLFVAAVFSLAPIWNPGFGVAGTIAVEAGAILLALIGLAALRFGIRAKKLGITDEQLGNDLMKRFRAKFR
jgi:hypothetical protein